VNVYLYPSFFFFFPATTACCFLFLFGVYVGVYQGSSFVLQKTVFFRARKPNESVCVTKIEREREGAAKISVAGGKVGLNAKKKSGETGFEEFDSRIL